MRPSLQPGLRSAEYASCLARLECITCSTRSWNLESVLPPGFLLWRKKYRLQPVDFIPTIESRGACNRRIWCKGGVQVKSVQPWTLIIIYVCGLSSLSTCVDDPETSEMILSVCFDSRCMRPAIQTSFLYRGMTDGAYVLKYAESTMALEVVGCAYGWAILQWVINFCWQV
jgi:hypothetical protein